MRSYLVPLAEAGELPANGEADLRYAGQSFELTVPLGGDLAESFHRAHEERYGYADRDRAIELVAVRTAEVRPGPRARAEQVGPTGRDRPGRARTGRRRPAGCPLGGWGLGMVTRGG